MGRFELETLRGTGAMGAVFAARDPRLDRRVAVKLLTIPDRAAHAEQLLAEAKALARLSHPNIVTVYEAGVEADDLFLVMELVDGGPLHELWADGTPPRRELLAAFVQAGEGLVAMHEAGIVHCDFKPSNVLVTRDGRVKVADFGLARQGDVSPPHTADASPTADERTSTATRRGTPAYMAPEQLAGARPDARSDQFSFCVCLWEALHGGRPFGADAFSGSDARPPEPRRARPVPRWLDRALVRGLAADPAARWPTMRALVDVLRETPQRRRTMQWGALVLAVPLAAGIGLSLREDPGCPERPEDLAGVWDAERRDAIATAWQTGPPFERDSWPVVRDELDRWAQAWVEVQQQACHATFEERRRSDAAFDRTMACLHRRRAALGSAVELLSSGRPEIAAAAGNVLAALEAPRTCLDEPTGESTDRLAMTPTPAAIAAEQRVDRASLLIAAGDPMAAVDELDAVPSQLPEGSPVVAEHHLVRGRGLSIGGRWDEAARTLFQAAQLALREEHDTIAADAFLELAELHVDREQYDEASRWLDLADAEQQRVQAEPRRRAQLHDVVGRIAAGTHDPKQAEASHRAALEPLEGGGVSDPLAFTIRRHLAVSLAEQGRFAEAGAIYTALAAEIEAVFGAQHPDLGTIEKDLAIDARARGELRVALAHAERGHRLLVGAFGEESIRVAPTLTLRADLLSELGAPDEAVPLAAQAWRLQRDHLPPESTERGSALAVLAWAHLQTGAFEAALASNLELELEYQQGPHRDQLPGISHDIGYCLCALGRCSEAHERFTTLHQQLPADAPLAPYVASGLAASELARAQPERAEALAASTLARVLAAGPDDADLRAELRLVAAACRLAVGDRAAAEVFAREAANDRPSPVVRALFDEEVLALLDAQ